MQSRSLSEQLDNGNSPPAIFGPLRWGVTCPDFCSMGGANHPLLADHDGKSKFVKEAAWVACWRGFCSIEIIARRGTTTILRRNTTQPGRSIQRMSRQLFVAYCRIGTDRQGRFDFGLGVQHRAVAEYLDGGERDLVGIYTEVESGEWRDRPELARALEACRRQKATLIVARRDSLARDASVLLAIFDVAADCDVVFCDPPPGSRGRTRRPLAARMAGAAEPEADLTSWRGRHAWPTAGASGNSVGWAVSALHDEQSAISPGTAVNRRLADQRAADILPVIRSLQASGIRTLQGLANALNARGVRTARGGRWYPTMVRNVLRRRLSGARQAVGEPECFSAIGSWHAGSNECRPGVLERMRRPIEPLRINS
jgi:hypothetical protein